MRPHRDTPRQQPVIELVPGADVFVPTLFDDAGGRVDSPARAAAFFVQSVSQPGTARVAGYNIRLADGDSSLAPTNPSRRSLPVWSMDGDIGVI